MEDQNEQGTSGRSGAAQEVQCERKAAFVVAWTRFIVIIPVIGVMASSLVLVIVGAITTVQKIGEVFGIGVAKALPVKEALIAFVELADLYLLAIVLYIIALGLYELFIKPIPGLPAWLTFHTLDDLKKQLVGVVIVVMAVLFLGRVIHSGPAIDLLYIGASIALVTVSLTYFLSGVADKKMDHKDR